MAVDAHGKIPFVPLAMTIWDASSTPWYLYHLRRGRSKTVPYNALALNDDDGVFSSLCFSIIQAKPNEKLGGGCA